MAEAQSSESRKRRRLTLAGAALAGAAAVGFAWLFVGGSSSNDLAQSLGQAPGIPPPDYAYLDTARVALYLGQLQGRLARSEQLSEQLTQGRNARCRLRIPSYIQLAQLNFRSSRYFSPSMAYQGLGEGQPLTAEALERALVRAGRRKYFLGGGISIREGEAQIARTMGHLAAVVKRNPRVPFSTCDGSAAAKPRGVDLLFPVRLGALSSEPTLLSSPVTIVGKLVRSVRPDHEYVDQPSLAEFEVATRAVDNAAYDKFASDEENEKLSGELASDAAVLAPGAVILPIAIYK